MAVSVKNFNQLVSQMATAMQGSCAKLTNFSIGTVNRAIVEAFAAVALFLQAQVLQVLALTRASSSTGSDLDTFGADYGFTRLAAVSSTGLATFSRFSAIQAALVPVGAQVTTADGSQTFTVIADTTNASYSASQGGYPVAAGVAAVSPTVQAVNGGVVGNIAANTLTLLGSPIPGIDTVTNASSFTNGIDAETDQAMRTRFVGFIAALARATKAAIGYAIGTVQQGLTYTIVEQYDFPGTNYDTGSFYVVVDDGTGSPPSSLLTNVSNAIDAYRACGIRYSVNPPTVVTATVALSITVASGYNKSQLQPIVQAAIVAYVNGLGLGVTLPFTRLAQIAYDASPGITNVSGVTLNAGTADLTATSVQVIRATTGSVTVS